MPVHLCETNKMGFEPTTCRIGIEVTLLYDTWYLPGQKTIKANGSTTELSLVTGAGFEPATCRLIVEVTFIYGTQFNYTG